MNPALATVNSRRFVPTRTVRAVIMHHPVVVVCLTRFVMAPLVRGFPPLVRRRGLHVVPNAPASKPALHLRPDFPVYGTARETMYRPTSYGHVSDLFPR
jgi:hypothetical protein